MGSAARTKAACAKSVRDEVCTLSTVELQHRLGKSLEDRPGVLFSADHKFDTNERPWEGLTLDSRPNMDCAERLQRWSRDHLASLSPDRRAQLNSEWEQSHD